MAVDGEKLFEIAHERVGLPPSAHIRDPDSESDREKVIILNELVATLRDIKNIILNALKGSKIVILHEEEEEEVGEEEESLWHLNELTIGSEIDLIAYLRAYGSVFDTKSGRRVCPVSFASSDSEDAELIEMSIWQGTIGYFRRKVPEGSLVKLKKVNVEDHWSRDGEKMLVWTTKSNVEVLEE